MRRLACLLATVLLAAGCSGGRANLPDALPDGSPAPGTPTAAPRGGGTPAPPGRLSTPAPQPDGGRSGPSGGGGRPGGGGGGPSANDDGGLGGNALAYLRGSVPRMAIEVDAVSGKRPETSSLDHLRGSLQEVLDKPGGIEMPVTEIPPADTRYSLEDVKALERRHRNTHSDGQRASLYVLVLNGSWEDDPPGCPNNPPPGEGCSLGVAYSASAYVLFADAIRAAAGPLVSTASIERAVLLHEAGHLLRLVNIGYESPRNHEDPQHPHHSRNSRSVMYWAVDSGLLGQVFNGPPPDTFDADDKADLADLKAGRLP